MPSVFGAIFVAFFMVAVPAIILMVIWSAVMAFRLCYPERPLPFMADPYAERQAARARGEIMKVGVREIREDLRRQLHEPALPYDFEHDHGSDGLPEPWLDDLWLRRN
ncbi:MAG: hypothetical protein AAF809_10150 [Bacteroidota bacterium]